MMNKQTYCAEFVGKCEHLRECIKPVRNVQEKFICCKCKTNPIAFKSLLIHIESVGHIAHFKTPKQQEERNHAVQLLKNDHFPQKVRLSRGSATGQSVETLDMIVEAKNNRDNYAILNDQTFFRFQVANFINKNNLSFMLTNSLVLFIRELLEVHSVSSLQKYTTDRQQTSYCIQAQASRAQQLLLQSLSTSPYLLMVDNGIAEDNNEYLEICARLFQGSSEAKATTKMLCLLPLTGSATGVKLYELLSNFLFKNEYAEAIRSNIVGISSDHASNMIGKKQEGGKGATDYLKREFPHLVVVYDLCK